MLIDKLQKKGFVGENFTYGLVGEVKLMCTKQRKLFSCKCFALIKLLVVIVIIAILTSMLLPALNNARATVKRITCSNNLKQIGVAATMYIGDNDSCLPVGYNVKWGCPFFLVPLYPYLGFDRLVSIPDDKRISGRAILVCFIHE